MESPESVFKNNSSDIVKDLESLYERLKVVTQTIQTPEESLDQINNDVIEPETNKDLTYSESDLRSPETIPNEVCSCRKVFRGSNKTMCSLCGQNIPEIIKLVQEKLKFEDEVEVLDEIIKDERIEKERLESIRRDLEAKIEKLEDELDDSCDKMNALKDDLNTINAKYIDEIEKLSEVQHSKALVEHELEELSKSLFEEANKMVSEEARNRHTAEQAKERLEDEVMNLKKQLFLQSNLNRDLKKKLKQSSSPMLHSQDTDENLQNLYNNSLDEDFVCDIVLDNIEEDEENLDELQLEQFETFAASCVNSPFPKILQHPFLKRCIEEDIEPCLKFGPNPRIYPRRIVDAIIHNTLQILNASSVDEISPANSVKSNSNTPEASGDSEVSVSSPQSNSMGGMWSRWSTVAAQAISAANKISSSLPVKGCHACGQEAACPYRLQIVERQDPIPLDKFCKDRIVACQDFFNFISGIREGHFNTRRIDDLYTESLRLRLRMFYARLGFLPSYGIEIPKTLEYLSSPSFQLAPLLEEVEPPTSPR